MATEVSSNVGFVKCHEEDKHRSRALSNQYSHRDKSTPLITRDLLGGLRGTESPELNLDLQVPLGWEKRLNLKSGKVYIQRCSPTSSSDEGLRANQSVLKFQDLNSPPSPCSKSPLRLSEDTNLALKLTSSPVPRSSPCSYQSVCTLDKVKSALEKAEREPARKRPASWRTPPTAAPDSSSSWPDVEIQAKDKGLTLWPVAAGCPSCMMYVLTSRRNPKCPRCRTMIPMPTSKRSRIDDLDITI